MHTTHRSLRSLRARKGLTLVEVLVSIVLLGGVLLSLGRFSATLATTAGSSRMTATAAQLVAERLEWVKASATYLSIDTMAATETPPLPAKDFTGYKRQTWVARIGGAPTDSIDYKIITVEVSNTNLKKSVRKSTVIAPF